MPELTVISWREIQARSPPAREGVAPPRAQLSERFQEAIDARDARRADRHRLVPRGVAARHAECGDDLDAEVAATAAQLEQDYTDERLERIVRSNGEEEHA